MRPIYKYLLFGLATTLIVVVLVTLFFIKPWQKKDTNKNSKAKTNVAIIDKKDLKHATVITVDPNKESNIDVYTSKKIVINLEIPKGILDKIQKIAIIPYTTSDPANPVKILIFPQNLTFKKPITVTFDLSRSAYRLSAPEFITTNGRVTGNTQLFFTNKLFTNPMPALISRSTETSKSITARILSAGLYSLTTDGKNKSLYARSALKNKKVDILTTLESASALLFNKEKLSSDEKNMVIKAISIIESQKDASVYEMYTAFALGQILKDKKTSFSFFKEVYATDPYEDYLKFACGKESETPDKLAVLANTAKLGGYSDVEKKCIDHARTLVVEESRDLLNGDPTTGELVAQMRRNDSFGLPAGTNNPLQKRINEILVKEIKDLINRGASKEELSQKLAEVQTIGKVDEKWQDIVLDKISQKAYEDAKKVIDDPRSTPSEINQALIEAQLYGVKPEGDEDIQEAFRKRMNRTPQEILDSPDSTIGEIVEAWINTEGTDPELHEKLRERKQAERHKNSTNDFPTGAPTIPPEDAEQGIDSDLLTIPIYELMGGTTFDQNGMNELSNEYIDYAHELVDVTAEACQGTLEMIDEFGAPEGVDVSELRSECDKSKMDQVVTEGERDAAAEAEKVGEGQDNFDSFSDDQSDWHIEIEITPTPEIEPTEEPIIEPTEEPL